MSSLIPPYLQLGRAPLSATPTAPATSFPQELLTNDWDYARPSEADPKKKKLRNQGKAAKPKRRERLNKLLVAHGINEKVPNQNALDWSTTTRQVIWDWAERVFQGQWVGQVEYRERDEVDYVEHDEKQDETQVSADTAGVKKGRTLIKAKGNKRKGRAASDDVDRYEEPEFRLAKRPRVEKYDDDGIPDYESGSEYGDGHGSEPESVEDEDDSEEDARLIDEALKFHGSGSSQAVSRSQSFSAQQSVDTQLLLSIPSTPQLIIDPFLSAPALAPAQHPPRQIPPPAPASSANSSELPPDPYLHVPVLTLRPPRRPYTRSSTAISKPIPGTKCGANEWNDNLYHAPTGDLPKALLSLDDTKPWARTEVPRKTAFSYQKAISKPRYENCIAALKTGNWHCPIWFDEEKGEGDEFESGFDYPRVRVKREIVEEEEEGMEGVKEWLDAGASKILVESIRRRRQRREAEEDVFPKGPVEDVEKVQKGYAAEKASREEDLLEKPLRSIEDDVDEALDKWYERTDDLDYNEGEPKLEEEEEKEEIAET